MSVSPRKPGFALHDIGVAFGGVFACRGLNIEFTPGEVHAIVGENGAGKSTAMKCLAGVLRPTEGRIEADGAAVSFASPHEAEERGVSLIPQELDLFPELSIVENLFLGRRRPRRFWGGFDSREMRAVALDALDRLGVKFDPRTPVKHLSAANAKIVEIARALARNARLVIMDEPTAALTDREVANLFEVIADLKRQGVAIGYVSHRLDEIFAIADHITVLRDGRQVQTGPIADYTRSSLVPLMVGRPLEELFVRTLQPLGPPALEARCLNKAGEFDSVSFTLHKGEILGLSGLIGAGRTEVAHALYGVAPPDSGEIRLNGQIVRISRPDEALRLGVAYLPEERRSQGLVAPMSIGWNIGISCLDRFSRAGFVDESAELSFAREATRRMGVRGGSIDEPVSHLSGGNQQKVVLARTLARDPEVIILDEPTRGVDVGAKSDIYRLMDGLAKEGRAILLISSEMNELISMSDRIVALHEGKVSGRFEREFSANEIGAAAMGRDRAAVDAVK